MEIDIIYPKTHRDSGDSCLQQDALVTRVLLAEVGNPRDSLGLATDEHMSHLPFHNPSCSNLPKTVGFCIIHQNLNTEP